MIRKVVVGIDGSEDSFHAYQSACELAETLNAAMEVIFVVDTRKTEIPYIYTSTFNDISYEKIYIPPDPDLVSFYKKLKKDIRKFGENCISRCLDYECYPEIDKKMAIIEGVPQDILLERSSLDTLIVIGRHGENGKFHSSVLGSTTEELIRRSEVPVMVIEAPVRSFGNIAYYHINGASTDHVVDFILDNFNRKDVILTVIHQKKCEIPGKILESFQGSIKNSLIDSESGLFEDLHDNRYDTVIAGVHGKHKLAEFIMGSAAVHLVRKSNIPLFIVN